MKHCGIILEYQRTKGVNPEERYGAAQAAPLKACLRYGKTYLKEVGILNILNVRRA